MATNPGAIRNPEHYVKAALRRRSERFNACFPRGITLGDIDSFVEINNHFLFIEWKVDRQTLSWGQETALTRLSRQPRTSVWILWTTEDGFITHGRRLGTHRLRVPTTEQCVSQRLAEWAKSSESNHVSLSTMGGR